MKAGTKGSCRSLQHCVADS